MKPKAKPQATQPKIRRWLNSQIPGLRNLESQVHVVAVRGYYLNTMGKRGKNDRGIYDDAIFIFAQDQFLSFNFNTDPSSWKRGRATLEAPQVVTYRPGPHGYNRRQGPYPAVRQASTVVVKRDGDTGNGKRVGPGLFVDRPNSRFWINLHRGGYNTTSSAGCQTVPPSQWDAFHATMKMLLKKHDQKTFEFYLIEDPRIRTKKKGFWKNGEFVV